MSKIANVMSISGGKDSTAMWIYGTKELGETVIPVFADTGHEHAQTYEYLDYLEKTMGPIKRVKADFSKQIEHKRDVVNGKWRNEGVSEEIIEETLKHLHPTGNPFIDLCLWKGRFPSTKARFCTEELKIKVIESKVYEPLFAEGYDIVSWQGVRADESPARANLPEREGEGAYRTYRPLIKWTAKDVFDMHDKHGIEPNPLYKQGMGRVGCMPCINCNKAELFEIARRFPEEIERVFEMERLVGLASKRRQSTFFATANNAGTGIHEVVEWSRTAYGGKNYDLVKAIEMNSEPSCSSIYGLCE